MPTFRFSHIVRGSVEDVFAIVADLTHAPEWDNRVRGVTQATDGPIGEGTAFEMDDGRTETMRIEVVDYKPPIRVTHMARTRFAAASHEYNLTSEKDRTRIDHVLNVRPRGFGFLLRPLISKMARSDLELAAAKIEEFLEDR